MKRSKESSRFGASLCQRSRKPRHHKEDKIEVLRAANNRFKNPVDLKLSSASLVHKL